MFHVNLIKITENIIHAMKIILCAIYFTLKKTDAIFKKRNLEKILKNEILLFD